MPLKTPEEIQEKLKEPFAADDLEWRLQRVFDEGRRGIAVPYVTNRAIQNRLDEVVGIQNWHNEFKPWHSNGKKEAQICGISIFFPDSGWITKWDGAEDSDIESIKGGLSDSMKRAAVQWGIGRVLYEMDTVFVNADPKSKTIPQSERPRLDALYLQMLDKLGLAVARQGLRPSIPTVGRSAPPTAKPSAPAPIPFPEPQWEFVVLDAKRQNGMTRETTQLRLQDPAGKQSIGFLRGYHPEILAGAKLYDVQKQQKQQDTVVYYVLDSFKLVGANAA